MKDRRIASALFSIICIALVCFAPISATAAGLLIADGGFGGVLEIVDHDVRVIVDGGIVHTEVEQVFRNTENRPVEALYIFPVPDGASVSDFSMWINGKEMVGEVLEKKKARQIYESYKQTRRDPGLLEQVDFATFELRIFPIGAGAEQRVRLVYQQELAWDHDRATWVYPLATLARDGIDSRVSGRFSLDLMVRSEVPIVALASPSHPDQVLPVKHRPELWQGSFELAGGDLERDLVFALDLERPKTGLDLLASKVQGEEGFYQLTLTAGPELEELAGGQDWLFVLDVSGSMDSDGKLALSRRTVGSFLERLGEDDRFELMSFSADQRTLFGQLRRPEASEVAEAQSFLAGTRARGGTILQPALERAFAYAVPDRPLNVVILSDGMTEQGERSTLLAMSRQRPASVRIFCLGIGNEIDRPMLEQLAEEAGGMAAFVSRGDDLERQTEAFARKLKRPAATNIEIDVQGVGVSEIVPADLPDLFHGQPLRIYGRYQRGGPAKVRVQATIGGEFLDYWVDLDFPERSERPQLERMWARHRIDELERQMRAGDQSVRDEIVRLGEGFSIVTEHTSFLVLESDAEYQRWKIERRNALRSERDRAALGRLREEVDALRAGAGLGPIDEEAEKAKTVNRQVAANRPVNAPRAPARPGDIDVPVRRRSGGGGGGAIDPISAAFAMTLAALALLALRRS